MTTILPATDADILEIEARHRSASKGPWESDSLQTEDGYGRFDAYQVLGADGKSILDTSNSESMEINEEWDEETHHRWDEVGRHNTAFVAGSWADIPSLLLRIKQDGDRIKALEAEREWQPIETAPLDETPVIVSIWMSGKVGGTRIQLSAVYDGSRWCESGDIRDPIYEPTHWQPLPSALKDTVNDQS